MTPPDPQVSLDSWPAIIAAILAGTAAVLVPFNGFMKTLFEYRIEAKKAEALKSEPAREIATTAGSAVFDSMAMSDLTAAIKDLTLAIRNDTAVDEAHHADRMAAAIERMSGAMDRWEEGEKIQEQRRQSRRNHRGHRDQP